MVMTIFGQSCQLASPAQIVDIQQPDKELSFAMGVPRDKIVVAWTAMPADCRSVYDGST